MSSRDKKVAEVVGHKGSVKANDYSQLLGQRPLTIWLTGLSGAGKSTLAFALERYLIDIGHACCVLDGDNIRQRLNKDLGFSHQDRTENIRRIAEVTRLMNDAGLIVITSFISPYRNDRKLAQQIIGSEHFMEVYVKTSIEVCEARDPKNMYKRARAGEISGFTGVNAPYEEPLNPEIEIDTSSSTILECLEKLLFVLISRITISQNYKQKRDTPNE